MDTSILPRLIHRTEFETHLCLNIFRICSPSMTPLYQADFALWGRVKSMNLGFKSKLMRSLFAQIRYAVVYYVEFYVESSVEPRCKRRFQYVKVVPLSRYYTVLRALLRDDQVVMQPTMITLPTLPNLPFFPAFFFFFSLWPQSPFPNNHFSILSQVMLTDTFGATSASLRIEDRASTRPLCSHDIHTVIHIITRLVRRHKPTFPMPVCMS